MRVGGWLNVLDFQNMKKMLSYICDLYARAFFMWNAPIRIKTEFTALAFTTQLTSELPALYLSFDGY